MNRKIWNFSLFVSLIAAIGGLLFGYNTSVVSGTLLFIAQEFHLTTFQEELIVSTLLIGALFGALTGGFLTDQFGRKKTLFLTVVLFCVGTFCLVFAHSFGMLLMGRFVAGLGVGVISMAAPLYIAEMSPIERRGSLISLYQLAITVGILIAYIASYYFGEVDHWRQAYTFALVPVAIQLAGLFFIPETPAWLGRGARAPSDASWKKLLSPSVRSAFLIGVGVSIFQQITGINMVIYYAPRIFQKAGFQTDEMAIFATILIGIVNVAMTVAALWIIDRIGRRPILLGGLMGMALSLAVLGYSFESAGRNGGQTLGLIAIIGMMVYVACFAMSWGPVTWIIISEIFPQGIRGRAVGIAVFANWVSNYFVSLTYLSLIEILGIGRTFWLYTLICLLGLWFVYRMVPETRGKTFEQIQTFWRKYP